MMIVIRAFQAEMEQGIIDLILPIQTEEFAVQITKEDQPDLLDIKNFYQVGNGNFWCAINDEQVVGTIALLDIGNQQLALRKMFVLKDYRGTGFANRLLDEAFVWANGKGCQEIYLGTTDKFLAAHRFYEKNGFTVVEVGQLPSAFPVLKVDSKFYKKEL
jgi:N-acetylglutamate synthase-like GNAT family acetyltransferase